MAHGVSTEAAGLDHGAHGLAACLSAIDWQQPWLAPWRQTGQQVASLCQTGVELPAALNQVLDAGRAASGSNSAPIRFCAHARMPATAAYEQYIFDSKLVPCRLNVHDFFNGLAWLQFPLTKAHLNALQAAEIAKRGPGAPRGPVRDAITVFDENAGIWFGPDSVWDALRRHDWHSALVEQRSCWQGQTSTATGLKAHQPITTSASLPTEGSQAQIVIFGHALLEKLIAPRKPLVVHCFRLPRAVSSTVDLDANLALQLEPELLASKPFQPVPVLGVPGWWPANDDPDFYNDITVFRPKRSR
jgi:hypothetical protein